MTATDDNGNAKHFFFKKPEPEIIAVEKEVPVETIKEITKTVEVEKIVEVIKEVPVDRIVEVIKEVPVDRIVEVVKEVPVEIIKTVEVEKIVEVIKEVPVASTSPEAIEENLELYGSVLARYMTEDGIVLEEDTVVLYNALVGEHYDTVEKEFDGYECYCVDEAGAPASGEVQQGEQVVTYLYRAILTPEDEVSEETPAIVTEPEIPTGEEMVSESEQANPSQAESEETPQEIEAKGDSVTEDALPEFPVDQVPENSTEQSLVGQEVTEEPSQEPVNSEPQPTSSPKRPESKQPSLLGGSALVAPTSPYRRSDRHNKATKRQQDEQASLPNTGDSNNRLAALGTSLMLTSFGLLGNRRRKED